MYKRVNGIKGDFKKKERFLKDDDGMLITAEKEIAEKWRRYFDKLLNCEESTEKFPFNVESINTYECPYPILEEIKVQVHRLKNYKSLVEDCVQAELLKKGGEDVIRWIWQVIMYEYEYEYGQQRNFQMIGKWRLYAQFIKKKTNKIATTTAEYPCSM